MSGVVRNPLTERDRRIIQANGGLRPDECPECGRTVQCLTVLQDGTLYVCHEDDGVGLSSRSPRGETDGCRVSEENDPTL